MDLVLIPARAGSKGIPGKNWKPLAGKPLISYTIEAALGCFSPANICISTDSDEIFRIASDLGVTPPFKRPSELSTDTAGSYEVIMHAVEHYESTGRSISKVILLQPTSPFRTALHIQQMVKQFTPDLDMHVSVKEASANPYYSLFEEQPDGFLTLSKKGAFTRRQDVPPVYEYNGAIYIINGSALKRGDFSTFKKVKKFLMDDLSSIDLDTSIDWLWAEFLLANKIVQL